MLKDKKMRNILLYLIVVLACVFFMGFSVAKNAYASELNEIYTIEEIYDMYNILEDDRIDPWEYGFERLVILAQKRPSNSLILICHNQEIDFSKIYEYSDIDIYYDFNEAVRVVNYTNGGISSNFETTDLSIAIGKVPFYETIYDNNDIRRKIIYSSYDLKKPDGTVFFWAAKPMILSPIMETMKTRNQLQPLAPMVSLIPISLGLVVSLLAFRKVWKALKTISYQA